mgnify:CR=1 FL=1
MIRKSIIIGLSGTKLTNQEINILKKEKPWGVILFSRNIKNIKQVRSLTWNIRKIINDKKYPILIDEEGGSVSRLNKIINFDLFSQDFFGKLFIKNKRKFYNYYKIYIDQVSDILKNLGININTVPVLDVRRKNTHKIIFNRSYSSNPSIVSKIGMTCIDLYNRNKIATVIKHIPGHGLSTYDSHKELPIIFGKKNDLINKDFKAFKKCNSLFAMTAHIVYSDFDPIYTATHSKNVIKKVIRKTIGFDGILISDDISMKALKYGLVRNATRALDAGCNLVLHCNGNIKEIKQLMKIVPSIDKFTQKKTAQFRKLIE